MKSSLRPFLNSSILYQPLQNAYTCRGSLAASAASATRLASFQPNHANNAKAKPSTSEGREEASKSQQDSEKGRQTEQDTASTNAGDKSGASSKESSENDRKQQDQQPKDDIPPPPPHGSKTPWQVFMDTMRSELQESKEWNEGTKAIADSAHQLRESERIRKAREAYEKTSGAVSNTATTVLKNTASVVGKGAQWTWESSVVKGVRKGANVTGEVLEKATKPIRETEAFKSVKETIDDGASARYGGWAEKEERRKWRENWEKKRGIKRTMPTEDPNAGTNVTVHKDASWKEAWNEFREQNKFMQKMFGLRNAYQESENPLVTTARGITDSIAGFFSENETAAVIKKFRETDPNFMLEPFMEELREYILPEVLDAYVMADTETLKLWLSAAQFSVFEALTKQYKQIGLMSDGRILDIRNVDIVKAKLIDPGDIPVFIITCRTQEVHVLRKAKTSELAAGMQDNVQQVTYVIGMTRVPEDVNNPETRGWKIIEMQKSGRNYY